MKKAWRIIGMIAMLCLVIGVLAVAVGFFTGSSPVVINNHGTLDEYMQRLAYNRDVLLDGVRGFLTGMGF